MKEKIEEVFNALQELDIKPTPHNTSILGGVYSCLRDVYAEIEKGEQDNGRTAVDSE